MLEGDRAAQPFDAQRMAGPGNASVTVLEPGRLVAYGWTPDGAIPGLS